VNIVVVCALTCVAVTLLCIDVGESK